MQQVDVFNGDADGVIARHQWRLAHPADGEPALVTGAKREVALMARVAAADEMTINAFDISFDANTDAIRRALERGASIHYFDHHRADTLFAHARLSTHIDTAADICTSLIVDRALQGRHRSWAIAAAFGDNLHSVAVTLAQAAHLTDVQTTQLRELGERINYNAYGENVDDLFVHPAALAQAMAPYADPFQFIANEHILGELKAGFTKDCELAQATPAFHAQATFAVYILPDAPLSRRVNGTFANQLAAQHPQHAHAVLTARSDNTYLVSIRAPMDFPHGADEVALAFAGGGGRKGAAGINRLPASDLPRLIEKMATVWGKS
jgi:hypothetical protein